MRHNVYGKHLGRNKNQRTALFRGLIRSLVLHEAITTTDSKAKAVKGLIDRVISKSKDNSQASQNVVKSIIPQKEIVEKLSKEIAPRFKNRTSGFTKIVRLGIRPGDGAMMVKMSLISEDKQSLPSANAEDQKTGKSEVVKEVKEEVVEEKVEEKPKNKRTAKKESK